MTKVQHYLRIFTIILHFFDERIKIIDERFKNDDERSHYYQ